jgi:5,10-methylenetetrahydromethanopterin reductase
VSGAPPDGPSVGVLVPAYIPPGEFTGYVRRAEQLGFHEAWLVEDCFAHGAFAQAATALAATTSLRVGLGIIPAGARHVAFAAMEISTLAGLHPGRLMVGVGHGMPAWMEQIGAWPSSPLTLLEEYIRALRRLLAGEKVEVAGRYVRLRDVRLAHPPAVVPPVFAGVRGPRSLRRSGQAAQGTVLAEPVTPEYLAYARAQIGLDQEPAGGADRDAHEIVAYNLASVDDDPGVARGRVRGPLAVVGEPDWAPHTAVLEFGTELAELRNGCGSSSAFAAALPDAWVDRLAVVGTPVAARERLRALHRAGARHTVLIPAYPELRPALDSLARVL